MTRNLRRDPKNRCASCGLRTTLHFTASNKTLTCREAREAHRWASIKFFPLRELMLRSLEVGR